LGGLEAVADTLQQLWISYNSIEKLNGIEKMRNLRVLYMANNKVAQWAEFERLKQLPLLEELLFTGNPLERTHAESNDWRIQVIRRLPSLKKLDGKPIDPEEREQAMAAGDAPA
jgi:dynein light chain 1